MVRSGEIKLSATKALYNYRKGIDKGYISLHPAGIPHGPHPGTYEASIGKQGTAELAVMVDTFKPLMLTQTALDLDDGKYYRSWLE